ncbi:MAG: hypothetical protein ACD_17C00102G0005 [uncultured bacterium]|nr:MAG: hypothetical protein ACD_17C00102G0005 [uncultured bacterium]
MTSKTKFVSDEFFKEFKDRHFFTIDDLYIFGLFGTKYAVRQALDSGVLPFIQISKRRRIVPKIALLEYLRINLTNNRNSKSKIYENN